ncbi:spore coat U domain-containing protein [Pseudomonas typographi]|uniref:Spore coat protein U domain-containing protein n=1 Tax=Pseudomonas typographi TaxID=2715964 RepID=A0ABR7Z2I0_9PSED|nr:spore coat U domain-containing protein [Pseudomonas typographi]MBD1550300.1 spore coat protein U domain-containing protein [Pseudomonas typographi]MBD1585934.1 spore coat protein U domain-containing protein [Pseudomonas typographi]MBD1599700.1 spore coat protein U domain-containing protein [Pseudomonas typographi]
MKPFALFMLIALCSAKAFAYTCSIAVTPLNFGVVEGVAGRQQQSTSTITVVCQTDASAANVSYEILLDDTTGSANRRMDSADGHTEYQLYTSNTYQQVWGGGGSGGTISDSYSLAAHSSVSRTYTVYARMHPGRTDSPGLYSDVGVVRLVY